MDKPRVILFYELCRLCLEKPGMSDMFEKTDLIDDIFLCTGVKVAASDNLPRKICMTCLEVVVKAKRLRVLAAANEIHLKSLFDDDNEEINQDECTTKQEQIKNGSPSRLYSNKTKKLGISKVNTSTNNTEVEQKCASNDIPDKEIQESSKRRLSETLEHVRNDTPDKEIQESSKRRISETSEHKPEVKKISVRKDLFDSSSAVTSTTEQTSIADRIIFKPEDEEEEYSCEICKKKFSAWKKFYYHQRSHNRSMICPLDACGKKFSTKGDLQKHFRTHTGEKPYKCELCNKSFTQRITLRVHKGTVHCNI